VAKFKEDNLLNKNCNITNTILRVEFTLRLEDIMSWKNLELTSPSFNQSNLDFCHCILTLMRDKECKLLDRELTSPFFFTGSLEFFFGQVA